MSGDQKALAAAGVLATLMGALKLTHRDGDAVRPSADAQLVALAVLVAAGEICDELSKLPHEPIEIADLHNAGRGS